MIGRCEVSGAIQNDYHSPTNAPSRTHVHPEISMRMERLNDTAFEVLEAGAAAAAPGICFVAWRQVADEVHPD